MTERIWTHKKFDHFLEKINSADLVQHVRKRMEHMLHNPDGKAYITSQQKRIMDVALSAIFLPIVLPIGIVSALLIKLEDGGPIFYIAHVPGKEGEEFGLIKFRTMKQDSKDPDLVFHKQENDSRVTKFGKFARRMAIDEVPQLLNVLKGDMSIIGRRPMFKKKIDELAKENELHDLYIPWLQATKSAKPGLFDLATGRGRALLDQNMAGLRRRLRYEAFAINHASLGFDIKIAGEAIKSAILGKGAF